MTSGVDSSKCNHTPVARHVSSPNLSQEATMNTTSEIAVPKTKSDTEISTVKKYVPNFMYNPCYYCCTAHSTSPTFDLNAVSAGPRMCGPILPQYSPKTTTTTKNDAKLPNELLKKIATFGVCPPCGPGGCAPCGPYPCGCGPCCGPCGGCCGCGCGCGCGPCGPCCGPCGKSPCASLPPPCPGVCPRCIQYMNGYYYYPYGFWFCGPYHVTGLCTPGGPVCPGGCCGPCCACSCLVTDFTSLLGEDFLLSSSEKQSPASLKDKESGLKNPDVVFALRLEEILATSAVCLPLNGIESLLTAASCMPFGGPNQMVPFQNPFGGGNPNQQARVNFANPMAASGATQYCPYPNSGQSSFNSSFFDFFSANSRFGCPSRNANQCCGNFPMTAAANMPGLWCTPPVASFSGPGASGTGSGQDCQGISNFSSANIPMVYPMPPSAAGNFPPIQNACAPPREGHMPQVNFSSPFKAQAQAGLCYCDKCQQSQQRKSTSDFNLLPTPVVVEERSITVPPNPRRSQVNFP